MRRLGASTGYAYYESSGDIPFQVSTSASSIHYISLHPAILKGFKIRVTALDPVSGRQTGQNTLSSEGDVLDPDAILFVGANSASPLIVWTDRSHKTLKVNVIGSKHVSSFNVNNDSGQDIETVTIHAPHLLQSQPHFLAHYQTIDSHWAEVFHVDLPTGSVSKAYSLPKVSGTGAFSTSTQDANVYFTRDTDSETTLVSSTSDGLLGQWPGRYSSQHILENIEGPLHAVSEVLYRGDSTYAVRSAAVLPTGDWELIRNRESIWVRSEALAGIVTAEWAEIRKDKDLAKVLEVEGHENVVSAYVHRVTRHLKDLQHFPAWLRSLPTSIMASFRGEQGTISGHGWLHDNFGFRKLIIVATENGRLMALDSADQGKVIWNSKAADVPIGERWDVKSIDINHDMATVIGAAGEVMDVRYMTGEIFHRLEGLVLSSKTFVSTVDKAGRKVQIAIDEDGKPGPLPAQAFDDGTILVSRSRTGVLLGWSLSPTSTPTLAWEFAPPSNVRVVSAISRPRHDPVASIGKVLGDRSVMYKYLNPNLLLVTTVKESSSTATFYLLDAVSGDILYSTTHAGVDTKRTISSTMSENWFTYSLFADTTSDTSTSPSSSSTKGHQLVIAELYESPIPNDRGPLGSSPNSSSLYPSTTTDFTIPRPHVLSQAFLIPEEISTMAVTSTRQGITSRSILCTLPSSNAIVAIPRPVLDPRRPVGRDPTSAELEEGLFRYAPVIDFDSKWYLTHRRDVFGIRKIMTSPSLLESTSLVFAYGNGGDVFGTRISPSQAFDMLGKGFGKGQLVGTVLALGAGVAVLAPMVSSSFSRSILSVM